MTKFRCRSLLFILAMLFAGVCAAAPARALQAEQAKPEDAKGETAKATEAPDPVEAPVGTVFKWLNFIVVFGGLGYLIAKKAPAAFHARAEAIASGITSAAAAKAEAEAQLREAEAGLARLPADTVKMREAATREFAAESERLREAGKKEVARIEHAAEVEVDAARRAARLELREMAAQLASARAAEMVPKQITNTQSAALVKTFVDGLPAPSNDSRGVN